MTQFWRVVLRHFQIAPLPKGDVTDTDFEQITFNERMANERLTLETLAVETLYSGQFPLKINLVDQTELSCHTPTDAVLQFLQKRTSFTCNESDVVDFYSTFAMAGFQFEV